MRVGDVAAAVGKGLFAGFAGTVAITASKTVDAKLRGLDPSAAPVAVAGKVLGVQPRNPEGRARFANAVHWGYGTGWGAARGLFDVAGLGSRTATLAHFVAVWGSAQIILPAAHAAPPVHESDSREVAIDALHHAVYALTAGLAYVALKQTPPSRSDGLRELWSRVTG